MQAGNWTRPCSNGTGKGAVRQLRYRREGAQEASELEESLLWKNLHRDFDKSAGKVRIYADPEIAAQLRQLDRITIESAVKRHVGLE